MLTNTRLISAKIVHDVIEGCSLTDSFASRLRTVADARDRAFIKTICFGVCRYYSRIDYVLSLLLKKPLKEKESLLHALLCVGLYQLMVLQTKAYAAVSETVNACDVLKKPWAKGLMNAILREYLRRRDEIEEKIKKDPESAYAHPKWWIAAIKSAWPKDFEQIFSANNLQPPLSIRVNERKITREEYLQKLIKQDEKAHIIPETQSGIIIETPTLPENLPGFSQSNFSVQDGAAQLAVLELELEKGKRVLDACAAPGGKLTHILESESELEEVIAIDKNEKRMKLVKENLTRLKLKATCIVHDVTDTKNWWDGKLFDRILLDVPCSASGVIRRHPDIKLLRDPKDIKALAKEQLRLLQSLWPLLRKGGQLLYVTCSIFPQENTDIISTFLRTHPDACEKKISKDWGIPTEYGRQILPGMHEMDGFYYAKVEKKCDKV